MEEDCKVYIDPEEDEVYFGCLSEKEQNLYFKLKKNAGLNTRLKDDCKSDENACGDFNMENLNNKSVDELVIKKKSEGILKKEESEICSKESENTFDQSQDFSNFYSNASVELEHNYSTPMKNKIDKTILSTPKSVVKADRDGGFLKVLSEIALVKAEADANKKLIESKKEDEDKENQIMQEIRVTEVIPEKANIISPSKSIVKQSRRFRIISTNNEENFDLSKPVNTKSENFETSQNLKNKSLDYDSTRVMGNILSGSIRKSADCCNESINLIDLNGTDVINEKEKGGNGAQKMNKDIRVDESRLLEHASEFDELVLVESKNSEEVNQLVQIPKEKCKLVLIDNKKSKEEDLLVKETCKTLKEECKLILVEKENFKEVDQLVQTRKDESVFVGNKDSREGDYSVKEKIEAQKAEYELNLADNKHSKEAVQFGKRTTEIQKEAWKSVSVNNPNPKDANEMNQSVREKREAREEEHEMILSGSKESGMLDESLKETVEAEEEERETILVNNNNSRRVVGFKKEIVQVRKEEPVMILLDSEHPNQKDDLLSEVIETQKEEKNLFFFNKDNKFSNVSQVRKSQKEEPELIALGEENITVEKFGSSGKAKSNHEGLINPEVNSEEKLEAAVEDRKSEEASGVDPGEEIQSTIISEVVDRVEETSNPEDGAHRCEEQFPKAAEGRRFSKDARMIVDVLKKFTTDDTFNFTIQEIDAENVENSFLSPEPVSCFDESVMPGKTAQTPESAPRSAKSSSRILSAAGECKSARKAKTVEKERPYLTPASFRPPIKYFSNKKIYNQSGGQVKACVKKLPFEAKKMESEEKMKVSKSVEKGTSAIPTSRIPVVGVKTSKISTSERPAHPAAMKATSLKTPTAKTYKNPKFNNIESPINAYINNKPTFLVLNVKAEPKKNSVSKMWKAQATGSGKKIPSRTVKAPTPITGTPLPFVEYRSATPYKVENQAESKLPRLAPSVQKLIGSRSPRVLKHEGRFYLKTPAKPAPVQDTTILADPNEVSMVVCRTAQKSNTINEIVCKMRGIHSDKEISLMGFSSLHFLPRVLRPFQAHLSEL